MHSYGPEPGDFPQLPGPARFITSVTDDLNRGNTVVIVFPDVAVENGVADAILKDIHSGAGYGEYCVTDPAEPFPARIIDTFGGDPVVDREYDYWEAIIRWTNWHGYWVLLSTWDHGDIPEILARWPAQVHASGLLPEDCPKLVIGVRLSDVDRTVLERVDRTHVTVRWWWGILDTLDTQTRLAAVAGRKLNPVEASVITEMSVWDLGCVDFLFRHWDRTTAGLPAAMRAYQKHAPVSGDLNVTSTERRPTPHPPAKQEELWSRGLVDQWGHTTNRSPRTLDEASIWQRVWLAHNRTFIVHVEEERGDYERKILAKATPGALDDLVRRDDEIIEIGSLAWLVVTGRVVLERGERDRLIAFRDLRNDLAHRKPVNDNLRNRISNYLGF